MNTDAYFCTGKTHAVCQDYARHGIVDNPTAWHRDHAYAIVSDGCSTCPDTDIGARLLTVAALNTFVTWGEFRYTHALNRTVDAASGLSLSSYSLNATLVTARTKDNGAVVIDFIGDGFVAVRLKSGAEYLIESNHNGAPKYLAYMLSHVGVQNYEAMFPKERGICFHQLNDIPAEYPVPSIDDFVTTLELAPDTVALVLCMSDGLGSFGGPGTAVPAVDVAKKVLDIRSLTGDFVQRRLRFFLNKECPKLGWSHSDDFAVAGIAMEAP